MEDDQNGRHIFINYSVTVILINKIVAIICMTLHFFPCFIIISMKVIQTDFFNKSEIRKPELEINNLILPL